MEIRIYYCGECQYRKLDKSTSLETAKQILKTLYEEDVLGCELFQLLDGETVLLEYEAE